MALSRPVGTGWVGSEPHVPCSSASLSWQAVGGVVMLTCSPVASPSSRALTDACPLEGLPEEAFEHLTNLNYLYLANNKVRGPQQGSVPGAELQRTFTRASFGPAAGFLLVLRHSPDPAF